MTPDVVRDWRDNNGLAAKVPSEAGKGNQALTLCSSNSELTPANENPGERAGSTWAKGIGQVTVETDYLKDRATATALCHAILDCDPDDARKIMLVAFERLALPAPYGMPVAPFLGAMDEADFWADMATLTELKAYCLACFTRMPAKAQVAFLGYVGGSA